VPVPPHQHPQPIMKIGFHIIFPSPSQFPMSLLSTRYTNKISPHIFFSSNCGTCPAQVTSLISYLYSPTDDQYGSVSTVTGLWNGLGSRDSILYRDRDFPFLRSIQTGYRALPSSRHTHFLSGARTPVASS
jgi:hypothetical protein